MPSTHHPTPPTDPSHDEPLRDGSRYDVIVVGARAAGAATAMLLARGGVRTLLLDRAAAGADTLSTHALMRGGVVQLARWGLLDEIIDAGTPAVRRTTFRYGEERVVISIKPAHGVDALYAPRRTLLDPVLVRASLAAGVEVHHRTAVTDVLWRDGRVRGVRATTSDGPSVELHAPLVIGADGIRSTVARLVAAPSTRVGEHSSAVIYGYWRDLPTDGYEWNFHQDACSGVIPTNDGETCVFVGASRARIGRGGLAQLHDIVAGSEPELADRLRSASAPLATRRWNGSLGFIRRSHGAGWALVGDAGYFKDPISAHGLTDALRDAELLAHAVLEGRECGRSLHDALAGYESLRDQLSVPLFDIVDRIAGQRWTDTEIAELLVRLSSVMADEVESLAGFRGEQVA